MRLIAIGLVVLALASRATAQSQMKVILDTDIGDDIDDAYALALLVAQPNVKLLGVTTAFGQTRERAELAAKLLKVMGRGEVPVCAGRRGDHKIGRQYEWAHGFQSKAIRDEEAVEFLRREIERSPGEVTLVAIGPLTNLGDLLTRYPQTKSQIRQIVIMGGAVHVGYNGKAPATPEWNIKCDPVAAQAVFKSGVPIVMAGLESTAMMQLDVERRRRLWAYGTPGTDALAALTQLWGSGDPTLFDPVAVAWACGHRFADEEPGHVMVDESGLTRLTDGPTNATILIHPRKEEFLDWVVATLNPASRVR